MLARALSQSLILLLLASIAGALTYHFHPRRPALYLTQEKAPPGEITVADARARAAAGLVVWLDARRAPEYQTAHIPGALLLNEYDWENLLQAALPALAESAETTPIIIYCDGQQCAASRAVREKLQQTPLVDREILLLHGGWPAWLKSP